MEKKLVVVDGSSLLYRAFLDFRLCHIMEYQRMPSWDF